MASSVRVAASIDRGEKDGGKDQPVLKRRKLLDAGGPIEDDETARQKMRDAEVYKMGVDETPGEYDGFDPDNVADVKCNVSYDEDEDAAVTPMGYFAKRGDLPMMRWLYVNGADTRDEGIRRWFPMISAAQGGHLDICKWLSQRGAAGDIKRRVDGGPGNGLTPLSVIFDEPRKRNVCRWLILRGALCKDGDAGDLDVALMKFDLDQFVQSAEERSGLLKWAREHHQSRLAFTMFLMGTLSTPRRVCSLAVFAGKSGILELIGDYVGTMCGREARIIRQLTELLPGVITELAAARPPWRI